MSQVYLDIKPQVNKYSKSIVKKTLFEFSLQIDLSYLLYLPKKWNILNLIFLIDDLSTPYCDNFSQDGTEMCRGRLDDFGTILSPAFRAATVFVGIAVIISIICIIAFILFFMCRYVHCIKIILHRWNTNNLAKLARGRNNVDPIQVF